MRNISCLHYKHTQTSGSEHTHSKSLLFPASLPTSAAHSCECPSEWVRRPPFEGAESTGTLWLGWQQVGRTLTPLWHPTVHISRADGLSSPPDTHTDDELEEHTGSPTQDAFLRLFFTFLLLRVRILMAAVLPYYVITWNKYYNQHSLLWDTFIQSDGRYAQVDSRRWGSNPETFIWGWNTWSLLIRPP